MARNGQYLISTLSRVFNEVVILRGGGGKLAATPIMYSAYGRRVTLSKSVTPAIWLPRVSLETRPILLIMFYLHQ